MPLLDRSPEELATHQPTQAFFDVLTEEIHSAVWSEETAELLDFVYQELLVRAVATRSGTPHDLARLADHLGRVVAIRRDEIAAEGSPYFERWRLLLEMAQRRAMKRTSLASVLDSQASCRVLVLLDKVQTSLTQKQIAEALGLGHSRIAQIVASLEGWELVERKRDGQTKLVELTDDGRVFARNPRNDVLVKELEVVARRLAPQTAPVLIPTFGQGRGLNLLCSR